MGRDVCAKMSMGSPGQDVVSIPPPPPEDEEEGIGLSGLQLEPAPVSPEHDAMIKRMAGLEIELRESMSRLKAQEDKNARVQEEAVRRGSVPVNIVFMCVWQLIMLLCFAFFTEYDPHLFDTTNADGKTSALSKTDMDNMYAHFQDVNVMIFIGFGFLMTFLKKYGMSALSLNMMVAVFAIQWHILVNGLVHKIFDGSTDTKITIGITQFITGDFAAAVILITFGALIGKVTWLQMMIITFFEIIFFSLNENINLKYFKTADVGGSVTVHMFGAYFGLACSMVLSPTVEDEEDGTVPDDPDGNEASTPTSDMFAMIGTLFLFMYWPSFNSALAPDTEQQRTVVNTLLSITASGASTFIASYYFRGAKLNMVDIQNATLAGGVAVGTSANMAIAPGGAIAIGCVAGVFSVIGYTKITPWLQRKIGLHDTCGVNNLHGMPAILACIAGAIATGAATTDRYQSDALIASVWGARGTTLEDRTATAQAGYQALYGGCTLLISIASGLLTGAIASMADRPKELFHDNEAFDYEEYTDLEVPQWYTSQLEGSTGTKKD